MNKFDAAANMAFFLLENTGSVLGKWKGKMSAKQQRELFGCFIGKGEITINGTTETLKHTVKVGFGQDYEVTYEQQWINVNNEQHEEVMA